jgi:hypothetical protein
LATFQQPFTLKKLLGNLNYGFGKVRLRGNSLGSGRGYEMRVEGSNLECGIVCRQILINAKLQTGKREKRTADWEKSVKEMKVCSGL